MITKDQVIEIAKQCFDPEIPVNIWDLGLIYDIHIEDGAESVAIKMSLTSEGCPAAKQIPDDLKAKLLKGLPAKEVSIDIVFEPPWTPQRISEEGRKKLGITEE